MIRKASATWTGGLKDGKGLISTQTQVLVNVPFTFTTRFGDVPGTNPEELVAAAHAGCFSMAFSAQLEGAGITGTKVSTSSILTFEKLEEGWTTTGIVLDCTVSVPGADKAKVQECAENAKKGCPISRLLKTNITLKLTIEN